MRRRRRRDRAAHLPPGLNLQYAQRIDLRLSQLESFVAVAQERHFGRAALRLGLSQPQVSRHVLALEQALGVVLFTRTARRTVLTDAGAELLADARETLAGAERLERRARAVAGGGLGSVRVGFIWSALGAYLPALVAAAAERHRGIELTVSQLRFTEQAPALRRGEADLCITRVIRPEADIAVEELNIEPSVVAIPAGHRLAARDAIDDADLDGESVIVLARGLIPQAYEAERHRLRSAGLIPAQVRQTSSPSEAIALVAAGLGIHYRLPESAAVPMAGVVYRRVRNVPMRTLLVMRREPPSRAVATIAELIRSLFADAQGASNNGVVTQLTGT